MQNIGMTELLVIFGIALLLFGNRLPQIGKAVGEGIRDFKRGLRDDENQKETTSPQNTIQASTNATPNLSQNSSTSGREHVIDVQHINK